MVIIDEIELVLQSINSSKALGPYGLSGYSYKYYWKNI